MLHYFVATMSSRHCELPTLQDNTHDCLRLQEQLRMFALKKKASAEAQWKALTNTAMVLGYFGALRGLFEAFKYFGVHKMLE